MLQRGAALLAAAVLLGGVQVRAADEPPQTSAEAFVLMEAESGRILAEKNAQRELAIASTTKIMTAIVALEHGTLSDAVCVKAKHLKEGSSMYLREGEILTLEALLYGLLLPSGNDAAECIADHCGGSTAQFVAWMNEKARALQMTHTAFANPSGLDAQGHYSCAEDMARLAAYAMCEPTFARIAATRTAACGERMLGNHNKLLGAIEGCTGLKTGYTGAAGRTLVTCCERNGMRLIAVTLNDRADWQDHTALYEYGFSAYTRQRIVSSGETYAAVPLRGGSMEAVRVVPAEDFFYPLRAEETVECFANLPDALEAPVAAGQKVGTLRVMKNGEELRTISLVCAEDAAEETKSGWLERLYDRLFAERC